MRQLFFCLVFGLTVCVFSAAGAAEKDESLGWRGNIAVGGGVLTGIPSQLDAENARRQIDSLGEKAKHTSSGVPLVRLELGYTFAGGTDVYIKNREAQGVAFALGADRKTGRGEVGAEIFYAWRDVWKDPYIIGRDREKTSSGELGAEVRWQKIMGGGLNLSYVLARRFINDDEAGERNEDLRRKGYRQALRAGYEFDLGRAGRFEPFMRGVYFGAEGSSNEYTGYGGGLEHSLVLSPWMFKTKVIVQKRDYCGEHPDFSEKRSETQLGISENIIRNNPFGWEGFFYNIRLAYYRNWARQNFFESDLALAMLGAGYKF